MAQMDKQLVIKDCKVTDTLPEVIESINENNKRLRAAYQAIHNDINWKEWVYFTVSGRKWRIGPIPDTANWVIQELTGANWKNQSHWTTVLTLWGARTGSPEGVVTANVGSIYLRSDGGGNTTLYVKETGTDENGWAAK